MRQACLDVNHTVGVLVSEDFVDEVVEMKHVNECLMMLKVI